MDEGTRRTALLGIDPDVWFAQHPQLGIGGQLVSELAAKFQQMTDQQAAQFATDIGADFVVVDATSSRSEPCFHTAYSNASYVVLQVQAECS
jgi:hypothetical protein